MTFRQFAFNNVIRNKRIYAGYFLSSAFSVMVFFVYAIFAFHPNLTNESIGSQVAIGLHFAESIIYVFSFIFVLYSMSSFLKTRKKEFGLMVMHGMTNRQLRTMVFLENMLIGFFATIMGIGIGFILAKLLLLIAENLLNLEQSLSFYFPTHALILTFAAFIILFMVISIFTVSVLKGNKLIDLIKGSVKPKAEPKSSVWLSLLAILLIGSGYVVALNVKGAAVSMAMLPVTTVVIIGTYFLFTQLSVYFIKKGKQRKGIFWRKTNMILLSDLDYRMKDNARTFFFVAIVSTVSFSAIGSLVGFKSMMTNIFLDENPFAFEYSSSSSSNHDEHLLILEAALDQENIEYMKVEAVMKDVTLVDPNENTTIVKLSDYNEVAKAAGEKTVQLSKNEAIQVFYSNSLIGSANEDNPSVVLEDNTNLQVVEKVKSVTLPNFTSYFVVEDVLFEQLKGEKQITFLAYDIPNWQETEAIGKMLTKDWSASNQKEFKFTSLAYDMYVMNQGYSAIMFVGLFIGAVFFVAAGSFLYFRLYTDLEEDKKKFSAIMKMGLTEQELTKVITQQLMVLFFVPILVAVVHGGVALTALQRMFGYSLLTESILVLGSFFLIQVVYFLFIRTTYIRNIKSEIL
ncbi:ABC transporter permease [Bacillus sp. 31A1R]|uniref:ABC transporter permease n=1 Tax=Robertmurraya mangrovi TaxID=3098077 RepID=A0ABU5J3Z8_9BACI|nr:ABC transporter permease [Bacillus sp. 31A1R]MDZ5474101.1 ABC transporter permease [Bacillus sp. 31A1R]